VKRKGVNIFFIIDYAFMLATKITNLRIHLLILLH